MERRDFIRVTGGGVITAASAGLVGCSQGMPAGAIEAWKGPGAETDVRRWTLGYAILAIFVLATVKIAFALLGTLLGLAIVESYSGGFFGLVGPVSVGAATLPAVAEEPVHVSVSLVDFPLGEFDPNAQQDSRLKVVAAVHRRQGAPRFRRALLTAYDGRCAMTRYDAPQALEAAHIIPYRGPQTNHVANGLLLRADMHDLFDLGLVAVESDSMKLLLAGELAGTMYEPYHGEALWVPDEVELRPNAEALEKHRLASRVA